MDESKKPEQPVVIKDLEDFYSKAREVFLASRDYGLPLLPKFIQDTGSPDISHRVIQAQRGLMYIIDCYPSVHLLTRLGLKPDPDSISYDKIVSAANYLLEWLGVRDYTPQPGGM